MTPGLPPRGEPSPPPATCRYVPTHRAWRASIVKAVAQCGPSIAGHAAWTKSASPRGRSSRDGVLQEFAHGPSDALDVVEAADKRRASERPRHQPIAGIPRHQHGRDWLGNDRALEREDIVALR